MSERMDSPVECPTVRSARPIPWRAVPLALAALGVPAAGALFVPEWLSDDAGLLLWLTPVLPAFLLAYYRGWRGAAIALAFGMASLAVANVVLQLTGAEPPPWPWMLSLVVAYLVITQGVAVLAELFDRDRRAAESLAGTDPLTGLANRREAERVLGRAFEAARRGADLAVVLFDLDHFKAINDRHGHAVGDQVLREAADVVRSHTRGMDLSARFGGEEFLTVLLGSSVLAAVAFAERVRSALEERALPCGPVTVSAGVASFERGMAAPELLLAAADRALYQAKDKGRNRVQAWRPPDADSAQRAALTERTDLARPIVVLVVDDDPLVERSVARSLDRHGFRAVAAGGAQGALGHFVEQGGEVDVVLTDVVMPEMSGPTLVERLARAGWEPPVVYMSGQLHGEVAAGALPGGRAHFVEKPLELEAVGELLRSLAAPAPIRNAS